MVCNRIGLTVNNIYCGDQYISKVMGCRNAFTPLDKDFPTAAKKNRRNSCHIWTQIDFYCPLQ